MKRVMIAAFALAATAADAQGTLGGIGLGYPSGLLSARARATAGAVGEVDPQSGLNPASVARWDRPGVYLQYEPLYRRTQVDENEDWIRLQRFPMAAIGLRMSPTLVLGLNLGTLLERRFVTNIERTEIVGGNSLTYAERTSAQGSLTDIRVGLGWARSETFAVGMGLHAITGENQFEISRTYETEGLNSFTQNVDRSYGGTAVSLGTEYRLAKDIWVTGSLRKGFGLSSYEQEEVIGKGRVPDRYAASAHFAGVNGVTLGGSLAWVGWSSLGDLLSERTEAHDAIELSVGAEARGPKWFGSELPLRAGLRTRTLPFNVRGEGPIRENSAAFGSAFPLARGRVLLDFGAEYARRKGTYTEDGICLGGCPTYAIRERTWTFAFGLLVKQ